MRVQCLQTTIIVIFLLLVGISSYPKRRIHPAMTIMGVYAAPAIKSNSVASNDLDNLRRYFISFIKWETNTDRYYELIVKELT